MGVLEFLQINAPWLSAISTTLLATITLWLALQNRTLINQNRTLASRDRVVEEIVTVIDPLSDRLKDLEHAVKTRSHAWAVSDEEFAAREIQKEQLELFQISQDRFYYPAPFLGILKPLLDGYSTIFEPGRFVEFEQQHPEITQEIRELEKRLPPLTRSVRSLAVRVASFMNPQRFTNLPTSTQQPYLVHLTLNKLLMEATDSSKFLDAFVRNDEMQRARDAGLSSMRRS
ncbi:MAG: hypothetical protein HY051_02935 [Candidatus Aenigmarchaeota archaeon]|nr:hypothetical protein [Candidatus Aenigmarchaeota archaeon]